MSARSAARGTLYALVGLLALGVLGTMGFIFMWKFISDRAGVPIGGPREQCVATADGKTATLTPEQAKWAAVITAESIRRGLPARAATIALATAMQESSLRNIDYGDRDSVGLFQQRPSQGWGTVEQIMDPWYSSGKFYDELVKVKGWQTGDVNDVAQKVQRSGVPDGYRKHVENAGIWASVLTGHSKQAIRCLVTGPSDAKPVLLKQIMAKGLKGKVTTSTPDRKSMTITSTNPQLLWAATQMAMATISENPYSLVTIETHQFKHDSTKLATWEPLDPAPGRGRATITFS